MTQGSGAVVLFDGTCGFCEGAVRFIARRDPAGYFRFAPSQWPQAQAALAAHGLTREAARSLVLIEGDEIYLRSTASLLIAAHLTAPWRWARVLLWLPVPIRDMAYRLVAAIRHRLARASNACELPPPELRGRLLGDDSRAADTIPASH
jgi:predicted DCC family thiol-disulfide oxidoreductase YuxK